MNLAHTQEDWRREVTAGDTSLGYEEWVQHQADFACQFISMNPYGLLSLLHTQSPFRPDPRLFQVEHPESGTQFYALSYGHTWESIAREGTFSLFNVHLTGEIRWDVNSTASRPDELLAIDHFGLSLTNREDKGLYPTLAYILTAKRKSGPMLTKSYGQYDVGSGPGPDLPNNSHLCLYESPEGAQKALDSMPEADRLSNGWVVLEVQVSSPETSNNPLW